MCTVTYIPTSAVFYLTSNRDEHRSRLPAVAPAIYKNDGTALLYPRDKDKNGSWIVGKENGDMLVLLNGAFDKHTAKPPYRKSRGLIVLETIAASNPGTYFETADLKGIEPFTFILFSNNMLFECRWDGEKKYTLRLNQNLPHIWGSATLYAEAAQLEKAAQFKSWLAANPITNNESINDFHRSQRLEGDIHTVSITLISFKGGHISMCYDDLNTGEQQTFTFTNPTSKIRGLGFRIFFIKLFNWEYWPYYAVYAPVMCYWFWLSIKSRSIFFFNTANPGMKNGGFAMDSKNDTYANIPSQYCPKTVLVKKGSSVNIAAMQLPLIAKPDIGQRGLGVTLLQTQKDVANYARNSKVDFLLQAYISSPNEAGIFYHRMPGCITGTISGIVGKELMSVTGDGQSSLQELLIKNPRYLLQVPALTKIDASTLHCILPEGKTCYPAPYGNHCRGTKFIDLSGRITSQLTARINAVCKQIPDFYYGRLDIKYDSWAELCAGKFTIIEVNGAASEPAHMYDPKHSIFFAWKEIIRHWAILYQISKQNRQNRGLSYMSYREGMAMIKNNTQYVSLTTT